MIFKKCLLVFKTILKTKYVFKEPEKKELLIFDGESLEELKKVLLGLNYQILETRISRKKNIYYSKNNFFNN